MYKFVILYCIALTILGEKCKNPGNIEELIVGGQSTKIEDVPYQAALYFHDYYFCAGSIVTESHVVTAAHCVISLRGSSVGLRVRVGTSKMNAGGHLIPVKNITIHPKFSLQTIDYDVAVLKLKTPLQYSSIVQPIKLGDSVPKEGEEVKVSGWGYVKEYGPPSRKLRSVLVNMVDRKVCAKSYKNRIPVTNRMICASAKDKDACYGDSGGPLVHKGKLIGIVSTGEGCARKDYPGIYTSVCHSEVKDFINKEIMFN